MLPGGKTAGIAFCAGYHYPDAAIPILPKYLVRPYVPDRRRGWRQTAHHRPVLRLLLHTGQQILPLPYGKGKADGDLRTQQGERIRAGQAAGTPGLRRLPKGEPLRPGGSSRRWVRIKTDPMASAGRLAAGRLAWRASPSNAAGREKRRFSPSRSGAERESISPQAHTSDQETESPHKSASSRGDAWGIVNST